LREATRAKAEKVPPRKPFIDSEKEIERLEEEWNFTPYLGPEFPTWTLDELTSLADAVRDIKDGIRGTALDSSGSDASVFDPPPEADGRRSPPPQEKHDAAELPDLVTLDQAAATISMSKRTLERYKTIGKLPPPTIEGGAGRADRWDWKAIRPALERISKLTLPKVFPGSRRHA
jgi:hypothetical protein